MDSFWDAGQLAMTLVISANLDLLEIVLLSIKVSGSATLIACIIGFPIGALLATCRFPGRGLFLVMLSALMGLPPVVVGLVVYLSFSTPGPFGWLGFLYTPAAMIIAQAILVMPIIATLTANTLEALNEEYSELFRSLNIPRWRRVGALLWDARLYLLTSAMAGLGRALGEVGAIIIVGGNINHFTRTMTTTIALETARGNLAMAMALGLILLTIALSINGVVMSLRSAMASKAYA